MTKRFHLAALLLGFALAGCASKQETSHAFQSIPEIGVTAGNAINETNAPVERSVLIVTPAEGLSAKVTRADLNLKYVVLTFPEGQMASLNQRLNISRGGLKVGEVKVAGPQLNSSIVADIIAGEAEVGDDARDK